MTQEKSQALPVSKPVYLYTEILPHECMEYITPSMTKLFESTGNKKALEVANKINGSGEVHPIMQQMAVNSNANAYEKVYACFKGEKKDTNLMGYIWILVDKDIYGEPQLAVKQFYLSLDIKKSLERAHLLRRFISYILDIGKRCKVQSFKGGIMQPELVDFWRKMKGFRGIEVNMEYQGTADQFIEDNPIFREARHT